MAVTRIKEAPTSGGGSESRDRRVVNRVFVVETDSAADTALTIMNARSIGGISIPAPNSTFPDDTSLKCGNLTYSRRGEYVWEVIAPYEYIGDSNSVIRSSAQPWRLPPFNISISSYSVSRVAEKGYVAGDEQGFPTDPIILPTGDKFNPPPQKQVYYSLLKFSYNLSTFRVDWASKFRDTVNAAPITILDAQIAEKNALMQGLNAQRIVVKSDTDNYKYWQVDMEIALSLDGFALELLMAGFHCLDGGKYEIGIDKEGNIVPRDNKKIEAVTEPQLIDADTGAILEVGDEPQYKSWDVHFAADWSTLNIPKSMDKAAD